MSSLKLGANELSPSQVLHLYQSKALSLSEYERAVEWSTNPPSRADWKRVLGLTFLVFGVVLIVSGVILFGAYNWESLPRFAKFGLLQVLIVGFWLVSRLRPADSLEGTASLWGAAMLVGAHLAVYGQVYQTGADSFSLFSTWALLILPWSVSSRANVFWFTQAVLLNVSFLLFWQQRVGYEFTLFALSYAVFNVVLAVAWTSLKQRYPWTSSGIPTLLYTCALVPLTWASCLALWSVGSETLCIFVTISLWVGLVRFYRTGIDILALVACSVLFVWGGLLTRIFLEFKELGFLLVAFGILAALTPMVRILKRVHARAARDRAMDRDSESSESESAPLTPMEILHSHSLLDVAPEERDYIEPETPFYLGCLTAMGAWIASLFVMLFLFSIAMESPQSRALAGVVLWVGTVLGRSVSRSVFFSNVCLACHLASVCLIVSFAESFQGYNDMTSLWLLALVVQVASLRFFHDSVGRGLFSFSTVVAGSLLAHNLAGGQGMSVWILGVAALLSYVLARQRSWLVGRWRDFYRSTLLGGISGLLVVVGFHSFSTDWVWGEQFAYPWLLAVGFTGLTAYAAYQARAPIPALAGLLIFNLLVGNVPGLAVSVLVVILAFQAKNPEILGLSLTAFFVYGIQYYYNLDLSFLMKSLTLVVSGIVLLLTRRLIRGEQGQEVEAL